MNLKAVYNVAKLSYNIEPATPLLIKSRETIDPTRPEMEFVRLKTPFGESVYLPGSSLKGAIRAHAERICRSLGLYVCDILDTKQKGESCVGRAQRKNQELEIVPYKDHCCVCRLFGSTSLASRVLFNDAFPWQEGKSEEEKAKAIEEIKKFINVRPGIAIDRKKGSVKGGALWEMEVLAGGTFYGELTIKNYQLYQLGLLLLTLHHMNSGLQKLGFGKSRGLGRVIVNIEGLEIQQLPVLGWEEGKIFGLGVKKELRGSYDLLEEDEVESPVNCAADWLSARFYLGKEEVQKLLEGILSSNHWSLFLEKFKEGGN
ncbi:MAG: RAMP superfamily CRISPR-associated protein [bacterium]